MQKKNYDYAFSVLWNHLNNQFWYVKIELHGWEFYLKQRSDVYGDLFGFLGFYTFIEKEQLAVASWTVPDLGRWGGPEGMGQNTVNHKHKTFCLF